MPEKLIISSESDAQEYLEEHLDNGINYENVSFIGWPTLEIKIVGEGYNGSLKTHQLRALIKLQESLYFQYATLKGINKAQLSKSERDSLELNISVEKGSTEVKIDLTPVLYKLAEADHFTIGVVGAVAVAFILGASYCAKRYFDFKQSENDLEKNKEQNRIKVINEVSQESKKLRQITNSALQALETLGRSAPDAQYIQINQEKIERTPKKRKKKKAFNSSAYEKGKYYKEKCKIIGVNQPIKRRYEFKFLGEDKSELIWCPKDSEISKKLNHEISMAYSAKKEIYLAFEVVKKVNSKSFVIIVRSIFRPNNKPRSYK